MESLSGAGGTRVSDAWRSMEKLKERLVLQLVAKQGPFWDAISEVRQRRNIVPKVEVPPPEVLLGTMPYQEDVYRIRDAIIPRRFYDTTFTFDWLGFILACLMYQPPRSVDGMEGFAAFGPGPYPYTFVSPGKPSKPLPPDEVRPAHELPPVNTWPDESPQMLAPPIREFRDEDGALRYYIRVDEDTTEGDVREAYWKIHAILKDRSQGGAPKRDQWVAVQCATLYDEENQPDPSDKRRWTWTHAKLAHRYGLPSWRSAKAHVELGRKILAGKVTLQ